MMEKEFVLVLAKKYTEIRVEIKKIRKQIEHLEDIADSALVDSLKKPLIEERRELRAQRRLVKELVRTLGISEKEFCEANFQVREEMGLPRLLSELEV